MPVLLSIRRCGALLLGVFFISLSVPAWSQNSGTSSDSVIPAGMPVKDEEIFTLVIDIMQVRLKRTLQLDGEGFDTLMSNLGDSKDRMVRLKWERGYAREALRQSLDSEITNAELAKKLEAILRLEQETVETLGAMIESSKVCVSASVSAKLYLFVDDFEAYLRRLVDNARIHAVQQRVIDAPLPKSENDENPETGSQEIIPNQQQFVRNLRADNRDVRLQDYTSDDLIALVDALLMVRLAEKVELSSNESMALFQRVGKHKDQLHRLKWIIGERRALLRDGIEKGDSHEELIKRLNDLLLQEKAVSNIIRDFIFEARKDLTVRQSVKLYLFLGDFEEYVVSLLEQSNTVESVPTQ